MKSVHVERRINLDINMQYMITFLKGRNVCRDYVNLMCLLNCNMPIIIALSNEKSKLNKKNGLRDLHFDRKDFQDFLSTWLNIAGRAFYYFFNRIVHCNILMIIDLSVKTKKHLILKLNMIFPPRSSLTNRISKMCTLKTTK